jgi:hypothetical protein
MCSSLKEGTRANYLGHATTLRWQRRSYMDARTGRNQNLAADSCVKRRDTGYRLYRRAFNPPRDENEGEW